MTFYAGIGSRSTPKELEPLIHRLVLALNVYGWTLRSGGASGADAMFEACAARKEIFLPYRMFNNHPSPLYDPSPEAMKIASEVHPAWARCSPDARKMHARNVHQIMGKNLDEFVSVVICWTPGGELVGGTAMGIRLAQGFRIPVLNLALEETRERILQAIDELDRLRTRNG